MSRAEFAAATASRRAKAVAMTQEARSALERVASHFPTAPTAGTRGMKATKDQTWWLIFYKPLSGIAKPWRFQLDIYDRGGRMSDGEEWVDANRYPSLLAEGRGVAAKLEAEGNLYSAGVVRELVVRLDAALGKLHDA